MHNSNIVLKIQQHYYFEKYNYIKKTHTFHILYLTPLAVPLILKLIF